MLVMDREPIRWEGEGRGLAWSERPETISGAGIRDWRDAACAAAACGLVLDGRRSYVHSSVAGMAPVYYMEHDGAVYFATTIDALALASPRRLSVDWEAWAGILTIDFPLGDRTPFCRDPAAAAIFDARGSMEEDAGRDEPLALGGGRVEPRRCRRGCRRP